MADELDVVTVRPPGMLDAASPKLVVQQAREVAGELADVIKQQKLAVAISGRSYVRVEGWTLLGAMLGVTQNTVWTRKLEDGWEARVEAFNRDGRLLGSGEAMCTRSERSWKNRDEYALRSMAQTRAVSKALRQPLGFVISLAGYEATPAEEMDGPAASQPDSPAASQPLASDYHRRTIFALLADLGVSENREVRLGYLSELVGRPLESTSELTAVEAQSVIAQMRQHLHVAREHEQRLLEEAAEVLDAEEVPFGE